MFDLIIGSLLAGVLTYIIVLKFENTPFSLNRLATQYGDYITGFLGLSVYFIVKVGESYGIGFRTFFRFKKLINH
jgi:hypothetical protein